MNNRLEKESIKDLNEFIWSFKKMLVCRYHWGVDEASAFDTEQLRPYFDEGKDKHEAYFSLFNVEQDLTS
jgi:hypothetical protein